MDPVLPALAALVCAAILGGSAARKLVRFAEFRGAVEAYAIVPASLAPAAAAALVALEGWTALNLVVGRPSGAYLAANLFFLYGLVIAVNLVRGRRDLDCGCAGPAARQPIHPALLVRNAALVALALLAGVGPGPREFHWLDVVTALAGALALSLVYAAADQLLANRARVARW